MSDGVLGAIGRVKADPGLTAAVAAILLLLPCAAWSVSFVSTSGLSVAAPIAFPLWYSAAFGLGCLLAGYGLVRMYAPEVAQ